MEPERLLAARDNDETRSVLLRDVEFAPPPGAEQTVWATLSAATVAGAALAGTSKLAAGAVSQSTVGSGVAAGGTAALSGASVLKALAVGVGMGFLVTGGLVAGSRFLAAPAETHAPTPGPLPQRTVAPGSRVQTPEPAAVAQPLLPVALEASSSTAGERAARAAQHAEASISASASSTPAAPAAADEATLVLRARQTLRSGDAAGALAILSDAKRRFGSGSLGEEREALEIETLLRSGAEDEARQRARDFAQRFPESPHARRMREIGR